MPSYWFWREVSNDLLLIYYHLNTNIIMSKNLQNSQIIIDQVLTIK